MANCGFEECQETMGKEEVLPSLYTPVAVNNKEVCLSRRAFAGEMVIDTSVAVETVRVVDRETVPEAALMVVLPVVKLVTAPVSVMVATAGLEVVQRTESVRSCVELSLKVPMAVNCFSALAGMEELDGAIPSDTRVALVTVTEAVPAIAPEVAVTVEVPDATASPRPFASTVRTLVALEDHCKDVST